MRKEVPCEDLVHA